MNSPHIQIIVDHTTVPRHLQAALDRLQARVSIRSLDKALAEGVSSHADVCIIIPGGHQSSDVLDRILDDASQRSCAAMVLPAPTTGTSRPEARQARAARTSAQVREDHATADEIVGRIKTLCELKTPMRRMREELSRLQQREAELAGGARRMEAQLEEARRLQQELLPAAIPDADPLSISTLYLPGEQVSGDIYDISRFDDTRFGFSIADATGHGLPAALLAVFVKTSLRGCEMVAGASHILEPDEVLNRLNRELLATHLTGCQFITAIHAIFDRSTRQMRWSRGGHPYPILLRQGQAPRQLKSGGGLIGAVEDPAFETASIDLQTGDTLLLYTDGLESLLMGEGANFADEGILRAGWFHMLAEAGPEAAFAEIRRMAAQRPAGDNCDDITLIAIRMN